MLHHSTVDPSTFSLLKRIFEIEAIGKRFALAGGTSLALQIGHRKSIDLDFFSIELFNPSDIEVLLRANPELGYEPVGKSETMLFCFVDGIKCDFICEPFPVIGSFVSEEGVKLFSVADIAAMKMHAVCGRGKKKDFFDIYALLKIHSWSLLREWYQMKYGNSQLFFLLKSITYFNDADEDADVDALETYRVSWETVKEEISVKCRSVN